MYKKLLAPLVIQLELTEDCFNTCLHCYNYWRHEKENLVPSASLSINQINLIMDELERYNVFEIVVTGGEPFLNKEGLFQILDRIEEKKFLSVTINSTLLNMTQSDVDRLSTYSRLQGLLTSIMGPNHDIHNSIAGNAESFQQTINGINMLRKKNIPISVNMVVSKLNNLYIRETAKLCKDMGIKTFNATRATAPLNCVDFTSYSLGPIEFKDYLSSLADSGYMYDIPIGALTVYPLCGVKNVYEYFMTFGKKCSAGVTVAVISARGEMRACTHIQESVGNIFSENLLALWDKMDSWRDGTLLPVICKNCKALAICGGGCRADAQATYKSLSANDPLISEKDVDVAIKGYQRVLDSRIKKIFNIEIASFLKVNTDLRYRLESFGSVWFLHNRCVGIFNENTTKLLIQISDQIINSIDLVKIIPEVFLNDLVEKQILVIVK